MESIIINNITNFKKALTDDENLVKLLNIMKRSKNLPKLVLNKDDLINELKNREYSDKEIEDLVKQSKFG